ncbi:protein FAM47E-like [Actinia tenebrosa]|uniref:Protein FAM47E-like n=1 Tax=Actinia tenebrosa TaxID=6105 RepID=A0A6P8HCS6_ACTTE|nr:protein FAM47E-like [Actinia tenebrosa]
MAHKYDLLLVKTQTDDKKRHQPWYRERLNNKYIKPRKTRGKSDILDGSQWTFLQKGSDDFRDGLPPEAFYNYVKRDDLGFGPTITSSQDSLERNIPKKFTKTEAIYSKALPLQQQRREHVEDIEYNLTQHPLALYSHLEESLPPDVFEDVVEVLDPEMNIDSDAGEDSLEESPEPSVVGSEKQPSIRESQSAKSVDSGKPSIQGETEEKEGKAVYKWLPRQEEVQKEERNKASRKKPDSPSSDTQIQDVTREFCSWVAGLGGESNNIEESTVMSLFASGYETKPALSVPIHVVELTNVPPELRVNTGSPTTKTTEAKPSVKDTIDGRGGQKYTPSWVKVKYGAWYLSPKAWKSRPKDEPLQDPKEQQDKTLSEAKKKSQKLDNVLATMHGAKAFKDFVNKKSTRLPEFLHSVEQRNTQQNQIENLLREVSNKSPEMTEKRRSHANIHTHS